MKRVIIVPVTEARQFPSMEVIASGESIAAFVGDTFEVSLSELFGVVFQRYLAKCPGMQELSGVSEAARDLAMSQFRLIQPYLEERMKISPIASYLCDTDQTG
jgi:hypothetical protein